MVDNVIFGTKGRLKGGEGECFTYFIWFRMKIVAILNETGNAGGHYKYLDAIGSGY